MKEEGKCEKSRVITCRVKTKQKQVRPSMIMEKVIFITFIYRQGNRYVNFTNDKESC